MKSKKHDLDFITSILSENPLIHRPDILFGRLGDGLDYCIFSSDSIRSHFYLNLVVNVGSIHEEDSEIGIANFTQQLILTELNETLSKIRPEHLININSSTDFHCTIYNISNEIDTNLLKDSDSRATFFEVLELFINSIYKFQEKLISFPNEFKEKIESIRRNIYDKIEETKYSVANLVEKQIFLHFHKDTLLPRRWPIGDIETIEGFTTSCLLKFLHKWYLPKNMCLFIVGDIPVSNELLITKLSNLIMDNNLKNKNLNSSKTIYETSGFHNIFCVQDRIGYKSIAERAKCNPNSFRSESSREFVFEHENIDQISISIGTKIPICPLIDEGEIFMNAIDTVISNIIHSEFLRSFENKDSKSFVSISWDFYNSSRENCGWNTFSVVSDEKYWKCTLNSGIKKILSICHVIMKKEDLDQVILDTISDYRRAAEEEHREDPKIVLDCLIDDWLCGNVPISKKQEYQLFSKIVDHITPEIIQYRCNLLFDHILNYFNIRNCENFKFVPTGCIFVSKPTGNKSKFNDFQENSPNFNNNSINLQNTNSEFIKNLLEELRELLENQKNDFNSGLNRKYHDVVEEFEFKDRICDQTNFKLWDALKASAYISFEKLFDTLRTSFSVAIGEDSKETSIEDLNGAYSIKELDLLVEKISIKPNYDENQLGINSRKFDPMDEICDLGSFE